ncbi:MULTISPECIES: hypothetical protein [unclassified Clostridium]|uniref:hypothetical protein n=1 Tax=unclassified Clostridium TaxID=2614128 RepID=UPI000297FE2B|nr:MULTISPECIES: hypothetical protein [unclassified Clostridium]EKQ56293.1 MAG: hypothetical protein A370_02049 [Clostridium sp. Maddingley MBC34-26]
MDEIKRIPTKLEIKEFLITFEYETWKGHHRKIDKRRIKHVDLELARKEFKRVANKFRTAFNVQILNVEEIKENKQEIVL